MPIIVVADDLTGTAEIAALGFDTGRPALVSRLGAALWASSTETANDRIIVFDTDSRLMRPTDAKRAVDRLRSAIGASASQNYVFKKVDSALRGNVLAELDALAGICRSRRVLLAPANPSSRRLIQNRVYTIAEVPLSKTEFARDPHHPARTDDPIVLLGDPMRLPVYYRRPGEALPAIGIILCETASIDDLDTWAEQVQPGDLPAGGRDFFAALLRRRKSVSSPDQPLCPPLPGSPLFIQGSRSPQASAFLKALPHNRFHFLTIEPTQHFENPDDIASLLRQSVESIQLATAQGKIPVIRVDDDGSALDKLALQIQAFFAELAKVLDASNLVDHFLIEGGATAGSVLQALNCHNLDVTHSWAAGVATLVSRDSPRIRTFTTKPGSYDWPQNLLHALRSHVIPAKLAKP